MVAADIPSGVDASTGEVAGAAIRAVATATFHAAKPGLWIRPGKAHAGEVRVIDIGIPRGSPGRARDRPDRRWACSRTYRAAGPTRPSSRSGNVFVIGGSHGLTGAPTMAAHGGDAHRRRLRHGRRAGAPGVDVLGAAAGGDDDRPAGRGGALTPEAVEPALKAIERADAVVLGPGLGRTDGARAFARELFERVDVPLVIDADGLNALAGVFPEDLPQRRWPTVLTPHAGELGRLLDVDSSEVEARRLHHAREAAARSRAIVVLKGDDTLVVLARRSRGDLAAAARPRSPPPGPATCCPA